MFEATVFVDGRKFASIDSAATAIEEELDKATKDAMVAITADMKKALNDIYKSLELKHGRRWPTGGAPFGTNKSTLSRRSGRGLRSIKDSISVNQQLNTIIGQISTGRMTIHETGGTITPKRKKYLALPMIQALDSRGNPRKRSPREWQYTFVSRSKAGNLIIFQQRPGQRMIPLYMLKKKVTMPKRLGMRKTFEDMVPHFTGKLVRRIEAEL